MSQPFHLINSSSCYESGLESYLQQTDLGPNNKDYAVISIIGCQSSGKSTFLNYMFETNFEILNIQKTKIRCQTTKGY